MTPEDQARLQACSAEIAEILYRHSNPEELNSLEGIEHKVREQMLKEVSPRVAIFLSISRLTQGEEGGGNSRVWLVYWNSAKAKQSNWV